MGDQPRAIDELVAGVTRGDPTQVLLGITGSGKTFTIANVIQKMQRPTLVIAHNKTLAPQLYGSSGRCSPTTPSSTSSATTTTTSPRRTSRRPTRTSRRTRSSTKRSTACATRRRYALLTRRDVIIVASVSCIYGIGAAEAYLGMKLDLAKGVEVRRDAVLRRLVEIQYERNDVDFHRGTFRVRGDMVEIFPAYEARRRSASSSSATRSRRSPRSTRCAARCCARSTRCRSSRARTTSRRPSS